MQRADPAGSGCRPSFFPTSFSSSMAKSFSSPAVRTWLCDETMRSTSVEPVRGSPTTKIGAAEGSPLPRARRIASPVNAFSMAPNILTSSTTSYLVLRRRSEAPCAR